MTTTDPAFTDRRAAIMEAARATVAELAEAEAARHADRAAIAIERATPLVTYFLETYGADPTQTALASGPCTDPDHALAWMSAAGFEFEVVHHAGNHFSYSCTDGNGRSLDVWLLHPETGERTYRLRQQTRWEHVAPVLVDLSPDTLTPAPEPERSDHPAEVLVGALRAFIRSLDEHMEGGF